MTPFTDALPARAGFGFEIASRISHDEPVAHGVLGHDPRLDELQEVRGAAGLGAGAGEPVAAERLAAHPPAGDLAVDVEVADGRAVLDVVDGPRVAREQPAGEAEGRGVD